MGIQHQRREDFEIVELSGKVSEIEMRQLVRIAIQSTQEEPLAQVRLDGLSAAEREQWMRRFWIQSNLDDDRYRLFAIRDTSSDEFVAFTGLQYPGPPSEAEEEKRKKMQEEMQDCLSPRGREFSAVFKTAAGTASADMGYDPAKHFHKRNTLMLPEYQRRGLGTWLTAYCNNIADQAGRPTFVIARPKAWKMLEVTGFTLGYTKVLNTKQFGWHEDATVKAYKRAPQTPGQATGKPAI